MTATCLPSTAIHSTRGHRALRLGRISLPAQVYLISAVVIDRTPVFSHGEAARVACARFVDPGVTRNSRLLAWVLMPDHAHWLPQLGDGDALGQVVNQLKSASARAANAALARRGALWSRAYHDHALRRDEDVVAAARYVIENPVRAGLANAAVDYPFWDSIWLPRL